jgi:hypothetical protein
VPENTITSQIRVAGLLLLLGEARQPARIPFNRIGA